MKFMPALMLGLLTQTVAAQSLAPASDRQKQQDVQAITQSEADNSASARATAVEQARNVRASREVARLSKEEKAKLAKDSVKSDLNPENSAGVAATARMQAQTTQVSKATSRQNSNLGTKAGRQQLDADLRKESTP